MNRAIQSPMDVRDARRILEELRGRAPGYVPEVAFRPGSSGAAMAQIVARYLESILQRLNQAPGRQRLAFFDALGLQLTPPQPARTVLVFRLNEQAASGSAPAGTAVAAPPPPGSADQIVFETERAAAVASGKLAQVVSLWPGRDQFLDHSERLAAGQTVDLFKKDELLPIPHHLYLAHPVLLALSGNVKLTLEFQLNRGASEPLQMTWEYWDGEAWRRFLQLDPQCLAKGGFLPDSTDGLLESGSFQLRADGAKSEKTKVNGVEGYWIRSRVTEPLLPGATSALPIVDNIRVSSTVEQPFRVAVQPGPLRASDAHTIQVRNEAGQVVPCEAVELEVVDTTTGATQRILAAASDTGVFSIGNVDLDRFRAQSVTVTLFGLQASMKFGERPTNRRSDIVLQVTVTGLPLDKAFAGGTALDVSKPFYPFGEQPQPGAVFYFTSTDAFAKPGAKLRIYLPLTAAPLNDIQSTDAAAKREGLDPTIVWEYWNGRAWALIPQSTEAGEPPDFSISTVADFTVPADMEPVKVNGEEANWMRARLVAGGFGFRQDVQWVAGAGANAPVNTISYIVPQPPILSSCHVAYTWLYGPFFLEQVFTYNDFQYKDRTYEARWPGVSFTPFESTADVTPALYLGFDKKPPSDQLGIFIDLVEDPADVRGPALAWEYFNGSAWREISAQDETRNLRVPGIVSAIPGADAAALARFEKTLYWLRARMKEDGPPGEPAIRGIFPNAVWASQRKTLRDQEVGHSNGSPNQRFTIAQIPILAGELLEVQELAGARANTEWRLVASELCGSDRVVHDLEVELGREGPQADIVLGDLHLTRDRNKHVNAVFVRWHAQDSLRSSGDADRHYTIDRARGVVAFGDGRNGRIPPTGAKIVARLLQTGGGRAGNVAAKTVTQLLGVVPGIQEVTNPRPAEGGSDGETLAAFSRRAAQTVRHRGRALAAGDYATLARQANSAVGYVRVVPTRDPSLRAMAGWIRVLILPHSAEPRPYPSFGLRRQVAEYLQQRAPADLAGRISVTAPDFIPVDVTASVAPRVASEAGAVEGRARAAVAAFLHPLYGGPAGEGWDLGRDIYLSDLAAVLERVEGVDYVRDLAILLKGVPQAASMSIPADRLVVAGEIRINMIAAEE